MSNYDQPVGFSPMGETLRCRQYVAASAIYPGDCVTMNSSGQVAVAAAGDALVGVAAEYCSVAGPVKVWDDPQQEFKANASATEIDAQTDINLNYNILANSPSTTYKVSRQELDSSSGATTATLQMKLLRIDSRPDNALGANVDCVVVINNHQLKGGTGTAGV